MCEKKEVEDKVKEECWFVKEVVVVKVVEEEVEFEVEKIVEVFVSEEGK